MEKRLVLAIALSLMVVMFWSWIMPKPQIQPQVQPQVVAQSSPANVVMGSKQLSEVPELLSEPKKETLFNFSLDNSSVSFIEPLASIKDIVFKAYPKDVFVLGAGFLTDKDMLFKKEWSGENQANFVYIGKDKKIYKRFIFSKSSYYMDLEVEIENISKADLKMVLPVFLGILDFAGNQAEAQYQEVVFGLAEKTLHQNGQKSFSADNFKFLGLRDRYFCGIIEPASKGYSAFVERIGKQSIVGMRSPEIILAAGQSKKESFRIYLGPQDLKQITNASLSWGSMINYGMFDIISQLLLQFLDILHRITRNWGLAIILLSVSMYYLLYPLSLKQMKSMKQMQVLQPKIEALRKAHKDNPQKLNKEIMEVYKEHKVNPLGGCLPMILQIPIFFALYQALIRCLALKGAKFLWIKDLSLPDRLFTLPVSLPVLSNEINILPIIMAIGMFFQQKSSMAASGGANAEQQKIMLIVFPIMFGFIFYRMPSGLVLYWFVNSALMLIYQLRMNKAKA